MSEELRRRVRKLWGSDEEFYAELQRFHEVHKNLATVISYDTETGLPLEAVYRFMPLEIFKEHRQLMEAIRQENTRAKQEKES